MSNQDDLIKIRTTRTFARDTFPGIPKIDSIQHRAIENGRMVERSLGDAMTAIKESKKQLMQRVEHYMNLNKIAITCKLPDDHNIRAAKLVKDILDTVKKIKTLIAEVTGLLKALQGCLGQLQTMKSRVQAYIQRNLNAIATMIHEICNLNFPDLPAIPSILGDLHFDGFSFPKGAFEFSLKFDANFAFGSCKIRTPNLDIFRNNPGTKYGLGESGTIGALPSVNPPLPDSRLFKTETVEELRATKDVAIFKADFYPSSDTITGSLPNADQILSAYEMPADVFLDQGLSLLGDAQGIIADLTTETTRDDLQPAVRDYTRRKVCLEAMVDSGWDWRIVWFWLTQVHRCRVARGGVWISAFDAAYTEWVLPGFNEIDGRAIPWHTDPEDLSLVKQGPQDELGFVTHMKALSEEDRTTVLWKLTYVEAAMLGIARSVRWDAAAMTDTTGYVTGSTRDDLDYVGLTSGSSEGTTTLTLSSGGRANYPSTLEAPGYLAANLQQAVTWAEADILAADDYVAPRLANRYVYSARADLIEINKFSQFWKEFYANWKDLQAEDASLQAIVYNYPLVLNSCLNPLASRALFEFVKSDTQNKDKAWTTCSPNLPTPYLPAMFTETGSGIFMTVGAPNGWGGVSPGVVLDPTTGDEVIQKNRDAYGNEVPLVFDPIAFLARADIQALPQAAQDTLYFLNEAYQHLLDIQTQQMGMFNEAIADVESDIAATQTLLTEMESLGPDYRIPDGEAGFTSI